MLNKRLLQSLKKTCDSPIESFRQLGDCQDTPDGQLVYIDNGADTLAVAHLDYVMRTPARIKGHKVYCPQLDDRLGAWAILHLLPLLGVNCDVLLTDSEEIGRSTARYFDSPKEYNWMFELDRRGTDVVLYEYDSPDNRELLEDSDFQVGWGSFSDISYLDHLGVSGFNFGIGYHREHSLQCYANLIDTLSQVSKFADFWAINRDDYIPAPDSLDTLDTLDTEDTWEYSQASWQCDCGADVNPFDPYCRECGFYCSNW